MNWFFIGLALIVLLWFFALLYLKSYVQRRTSPDHILGELQNEVLQLEADIDQKTDQNLQLLEEKIEVLRSLAAEAERRVALYSRELDRRRGEEEALAALNRSSPPAREPGPAAPKRAGKRKPPGAEVSSPGARRGPDRSPPEQPAPDQPPVRLPPEGPAPNRPAPSPPPDLPSPAPGDAPAPEAAAGSIPEAGAAAAYRAQTGQPKIVLSRTPLVPKPPPVKDRIAELYKAGFSPELIAERLGLAVGEVQLHIALVDRG
ncbi:MAG: hypothetical protein LBG84_09005 [Treponema sp.]|jgi:hypothetical protein|nr:hypothetical protein [Treponema sp.]